jgi:hypothetical protein
MDDAIHVKRIQANLLWHFCLGNRRQTAQLHPHSNDPIRISSVYDCCKIPGINRTLSGISASRAGAFIIKYVAADNSALARYRA